MIPKIIHYCWFGRGEKPKSALDCIDSWKKYLPDYSIIEWNEEVIDVTSNRYMKEAYESTHYAFVTDYVRLFALYHHGGVYMDTDVEVLKPLDKFLIHMSFSGFEDGKLVPTGIIASEKNSNTIHELMDYYKDRHFILPDGSFDKTTNVKTITNYFLDLGLKQDNSLQTLNDMTIYPKEYFCPKDPITGKIHVTDNTYTIHHFSGSWLTPYETRKKILKAKLKLLIGDNLYFILKTMVNKWKVK